MEVLKKLELLRNHSQIAMNISQAGEKLILFMKAFDKSCHCLECINRNFIKGMFHILSLRDYYVRK